MLVAPGDLAPSPPGEWHRRGEGRLDGSQQEGRAQADTARRRARQEVRQALDVDGDVGQPGRGAVIEVKRRWSSPEP